MDLERGEVPWVGREGALYERFRVPQAFVASACVIAVEDLEDIGHRDACEGVGIVGDVFQSALEEVAGRNYGLSRCRPVDHGLTSHDEVDGRGARGAFAAPCLNVDHLQACGARQACYNLVLNLEQGAPVLVEPLRPHLDVRLRVDELRVDADARGVGDYTAADDVANVKIPADSARIQGLSFVREGRPSGHDKAARNSAGEIRRQALRDAVGKIVIDWIAAEICERKHDEGEPAGGFRRGSWRRGGRRPPAPAPPRSPPPPPT